MLGHYWKSAVGNDYIWPYQAIWNKPNTWVETALGNLPQINSLDPMSTSVGTPDFKLVIYGENFMNGATVLWNTVILTTTYGNSSLLTATVSSAYITTAGIVEVRVRNPGSDSLESNPVEFVVRNPAPHIGYLTPNMAQQWSPGFTVTVYGSGFVSGATVLWNGVPCLTTYVNVSQLIAQIGTDQLTQARMVGVTVDNPDPDESISNTVSFIVQPLMRVFLPTVSR